MKKVAIVGTQGVPARYGGFETLVENLLNEHTHAGIQYTVFCSGKAYKQQPETYKGATLKYIPLHANGVQSILYDIFSLLCTLRGYDVVMVLGVSGCVFLPVYRLLYHKKLIVNIDGLEHRRTKWGVLTQQFLKLSEWMAVRFASVVVADNKAIQDYVWDQYGVKAELIAYGGDHVLCDLTENEQLSLLNKYQLEPRTYAFTVCRIEPENNCHILLEAFARLGQPFVFVGNWEKSKYSKELKQRYASCPTIYLLDPVYDLSTLYAFRNNCRLYLHGHSAGGTNPSLVEAMFFGKPIVAYDVVYNRETTGNQAHYFRDIDSLLALLKQENGDYLNNGVQMQRIAKCRYCWSVIVSQYECVYDIVGR